MQYEAEMRIQMINEKMRSQEESRRQALVSNERKREFLRYILHEIRVPLNALVLGLEGLKTSVDAGSTGSEQATRESTASVGTYRTPVHSARVREEVVDEVEDEEEQQQQQQHDDVAVESEKAVRTSSSVGGEALLLPGSPQRSPLPSPTMERSPVLFSNSSILPSTTSLSRASSLALSSASSASSPGHPSPLTGPSSLSSASPAPPATITLCEEDADSINEMWHAVSHMTRLLDDVLSLQRIEDGELLLERRAFSLPDTCVGAVRMMTTWLDNKGLTVHCDVDSSLPILLSDEYRVRQVLINFLSNAIRFTPGKGEDGSEGRIVLTVKRCEMFDDCEPIIQEGQADELTVNGSRDQSDESQQPQHGQLNNNNVQLVKSHSSHSLHTSSASLTSNPKSTPTISPRQPATSLTFAASLPPSPSRVFIRVSVHDSGIGISYSDLQRMFTPFVQISSGEAEKGKGTGLGLSICRKLIDLLGGRVGVISAPGKGSTFFFEAPFQVSADQSPAVLRPADQLASPNSLNADEASSRTINKAPNSDDPAKHDSPQLITSSLRSKRRAMHSKQKSSGDINNAIPLHPSHPTSLALAASSSQTITAPSSPVRMVARALTVPPPLSAPAASHSQPARPTPSPSPLSATAAAAATISLADDSGGAASAPVVAAAASAAASGGTSSSRRVRAAAASTKRPPLRVLVVDDADSNRKLLARLVSKDGAAVCDQARDGQEAVNLVQNDVGRFDVILCDKEMPVMDGYGAVREMRRLGVVCPIIGVTANALVNDQAEFIACGLDALVTKPVNLRLLMTAIHDALQQRGTAQAAVDSNKEKHSLGST